MQSAVYEDPCPRSKAVRKIHIYNRGFRGFLQSVAVPDDCGIDIILQHNRFAVSVPEMFSHRNVE
ncbi:hypothetical protein D3C81_1344210 [compost metagenome]